MDSFYVYNNEITIAQTESTDRKYVVEIAERTSRFRHVDQIIYLKNIENNTREKIFIDENKTADLKISWGSERSLLVEIRVQESNKRYCKQLVDRYEDVSVEYQYSYSDG